jgi:hypothetical protein
MGEWRKLHNEEVHDVYSLPSKIRIIKSRMRCAGRVARMREKRNIWIIGRKTRGKETVRKTKT